MEYNKLLDNAAKVIHKSNKLSKAIIISNFELGGIVVSMIDSAQYGDNSVEKFATDLTRKCGYTIYPQRLWEASRVYRSFAGDVTKVWKLEHKIGSKITWSFLVKNCTKAPTEGTEAEAYWEDRLKQYEESIGEIEQFSMERERHLERAPEKAKEQIQGFLAKIDDDGVKTAGTVESSENTTNGLKVLLNRFNDFLGELDKNENEIDKESEKVLVAIYDKIGKMLKEKNIINHSVYLLPFFDSSSNINGVVSASSGGGMSFDIDKCGLRGII
jgi:phage gp46-like protein